MFEKFKSEQELKSSTVARINKEIQDKLDAPQIDAKAVSELWEAKRSVKINGLTNGDIVKIASNVIVVAVIIAFEMSHVMNKNATKFIRPL